MNVKASELRIGNLVKLESGEIVPIRGGGIAAIESGYLKVEPIPLIEEWLVKAGFELLDGIYYKSMFAYGGDQCDDFELQIFNNDENYFAVSTMETYIPIEYVHQLQNLYFALTGEELIQ